MPPEVSTLADEQAKLEAIATKIQAAQDTKNAALQESLTKEFKAELALLKASIEELRPRVSLPGVEVDKTGKRAGKAFSLARAACGIKHGWDVADAGYEKEVFSQTQRDFHNKAASFGVDTAGGFLVPSEVSDTVIERLLPQTISFQLGVNRVSVGNVGSLSFNRETGSATATWVGEMVTAAKSQVTLDQFSLTPKAVSAKGDISNLLQLLGSGAAEERFTRSAARQFALAIDKAILIGANSQQGPIGIANTPGVGTSSGVSATFNKVVAFITKLRLANALNGKLGWALTPNKLEELEIMVDASNQPLMRRAIDGGSLDRIRGFPFATTTQMGTTGINTLIFGAWDQATFYDWFGGMLMKRSDTADTALDNDLTRVVLRMYGDVGVDQPTAFCVASD